jgi:copper chaperone NosL
VFEYLAGPISPMGRRLILGAAIVLLPVLFIPVLPVWQMRLWAPQYPEGLTLTIYSQTIKGDLDKINTLNHYVGMHAITPQDFKEFSYMPLALTLFGVMALMAALANRRDVALLGWLAFTLFAVVMFKDYADWLHRYGHELDPRAAIKLEAFTPPLVGYSKMANFKVWSLPGAGGILLGLAWLLGPVVALVDFLAHRRRARGPAASAAG